MKSKSNSHSLLTGPMPRLPRRATKLLGITIAALVLLPAVIRDADAGQGELPTFGDLPIGKVTAPPLSDKDKPPTNIPAAEAVSGFKILNAAYPNSPSSPIQISSDTVSTNYNPATSSMPATFDGVSGCYSQRFANALTTSLALATLPERPFEWEQGLGWQATIYNGSKTLAVVHNERIVDVDSAKPMLESTDAWFDPSTKGFRLASKATLPLRQVGTAPGGLRMFAGRDDRADGRHLIHFIVTRAKDTPYQQIASTMITRGEATTSAGACGHHRLALLARKEGDSGVIQTTTVLPDLKPDERSTAAPLPPMPAGSMNTRDVRTRLLRAQFSVSQTSRDKEPILSVATAWAGPEVLQRVFLPTTPPPPPPVSAPPLQPQPPTKSVSKKAPPPPKQQISRPPPRMDSGF